MQRGPANVVPSANGNDKGGAHRAAAGVRSGGGHPPRGKARCAQSQPSIEQQGALQPAPPLFARPKRCLQIIPYLSELHDKSLREYSGSPQQRDPPPLPRLAARVATQPPSHTVIMTQTRECFRVGRQTPAATRRARRSRGNIALIRVVAASPHSPPAPSPPPTQWRTSPTCLPTTRPCARPRGCARRRAPRHSPPAPPGGPWASGCS